MTILDLLEPADIAALALYVLAFFLYGFLADHSALHKWSIASAMDRQRRHWLEEARRRDFRMLDSGILHILMNGISIFASTNIFVIGGLIAGISYAERLSTAFSVVPFAAQVPPALWALKLILLLAVFVYAFFKFAWAIRLANYCAIMIGALAAPERAEGDEADARTAATARIATLCAYHFNRGLRANFFGLAAIGWFFNAWIFMAGTLFIVCILARREFFSAAHATVRDLA